MSAFRRTTGLLLVGALTFAVSTMGSSSAAAQSADNGTGDELRISSVSVSGPQTLRAEVAVPPTFDQVQLRPESFAVSVNGSAVPSRITRDIQPVDVVLAIDVSGSMKGAPLAAAKESASTFISGIPAGGRVAVVAFSDDARVVTPLSDDRTAARSAVASLKADGETSLYDGIRAAAGQFGDQRRALVLLSDGRDTASAATAADARSALAAANADVYAIALQTSDTDLSSLGSLVQAAGGQLIPASDAASLQASYREVAVRIDNRYLVEVTSTARGSVAMAVSVAQDGRLAAATTTQSLADATAAVDVDASLATTTPARADLVEADGWLNRFGLWIGLAALLAGIGLLVSIFSDAAPRTRRLAAELGSRAAGSSFSMGNARERLVVSADRMLEGNERGAFLDRALEDAAVEMRPAEFVVLVGGVGMVLSLVTWIALGLVAAMIVGGLVLFGAKVWLSSRASSRRRTFIDGLDAALMTMAGSLRAGQGLPQAIDSVARETEGPISEEFGRVVVENQLGRDIVEALQGVERRVGGGDFSWVVKAISIQRELGGDLAEVLDNVAATIRDRNRLRAQVRALSAEGRFSAAVLFSLPILTVLAVALFSPKYLSTMTDGLLGWIVVSLTIAMMLIGGVWMRNIVKIRF